MIALKNVTVNTGKKAVLNNLSLRMDPGAMLCVVGGSGSGKSTLLQLLIRAIDPDSGTVEVDGVTLRSLPAPILQLYRRRVGVVFQEPILLDHATVEENLGLPLELLGAPEALIKRNVADLLKRLNLLSKALLFPQDLSMSERALLCIARAVITAPMVIVADEPFQYLDSTQATIVSEMLVNMKKKGTTVVILSRDTATAKAVHADIVHLKDGKVGKQAEEVAATARKGADVHRILEEEQKDNGPEMELVTDSLDAADEETIPVSQKKTGGGGKRIRITSIGSNS